MNIQAELISIGNELLNGRTLNTHGRDLGEALHAIGLQLVRDTTISDDIPTIASATKEALERTDLVFVSGGLGPTVDDITRDALAQLLERKIILDQSTADTIAARYAARGRTMPDVATRQALVLEGAAVLPNSVGAAPGQRFDLPGDKTLFVLPGPPNEFNAILTEEIIPWLRERYSDASPGLVHTVHTRGIGEADIITILEDAGVNFSPAGIDLGFYPGKGKVEIRIAAAPEHEAAITQIEQILRDLLADHLDEHVRTGTMRVFIAIDIGDEIRGRLDELQRKLKKVHANVRWVKPKKIHLTLAFLGTLSVERIEPLKAALDQALAGLKAFDLEAVGTGFFGKSNRPRVLWAGIAENKALMKLQRRTVEALHAQGIEFDNKPFSPHLTLGRVKVPDHTESLLGKIEKYRDEQLGQTRVAAIELIQSRPVPHGTEYEVLHRTKLA